MKISMSSLMCASLVLSIGSGRADQFDVAKLCLRMAEYISQMEVSSPLGARAFFDVFKEFNKDERLFRIVAGDSARKVLYEPVDLMHNTWTVMESCASGAYDAATCEHIRSDVKELADKLYTACGADYGPVRE